jgi:3-methyladenine DNA glycosylase AlkC
MAEPFKNRIDPPLLRDLAAHLQRVDANFPRARFLRRVTAGLEELELKARVLQVAAVLGQHLPQDFAQACDTIEAALAPARLDEDLGALQTGPEGLAGWVIWPLTEFVAQRGLQQPERALQALHRLTQRFTAEFAIRPFLREHPQLAFNTLRRWLRDPSPHVRRLVSEGSRPRLPWGGNLVALIADPSPTLPLLRALQDDPSEYVRRSVANHLNDIAKDHPELVAQWVAEHLPGATAARAALLRRAARTLVKQGHPATLAAFGVGAALAGTAALRIAPARPRLGSHCELQVALHSEAATSQRLVLDYVVHRVVADGSTRPKVWKGWVLELAPGERRELRKKHSLRPTTVRQHHPGAHRFELRANGVTVASATAQFVR